MNDEFSLLAHLGVKVQEVPPANPISSNATDNQAEGMCKVWAPSRHPPLPTGTAADGLLERKRRGGKAAYADPAGEVLVRREGGQRKEYAIYNAHVPSVYGINKQLAEEKKREAAIRKAESRVTEGAVGAFASEARQEADQRMRREMLQELQACNLEQALRKQAERERAEQQRAASDAATLQHLRIAAAHEREREQQMKLKRQQELREAAERALLSRRQVAAESGGEWGNGGGLSFLDDADDARRSAAALARGRDIAEENVRLAQKKREERMRKESADRAYARALADRSREEEREERARVVASRAQAQKELYRSHETHVARQKALTASLEEAKERQHASCLSFINDAYDAEAETRARANRQIQHDREVNLALAEQKRESERCQKEKDRLYAVAQIEAALQSEQEELARAQGKKLRDAAEMHRAAERATAKRAKDEEEKKRQAATGADPFLFWDAKAEESATRAAAKVNYFEELRRDAERRQEARLQHQQKELAKERELLAYDAGMAAWSARQEQDRKNAAAAELRRCLDRQVASKKSRVTERETQELQTGRAIKVEALYRCPITGDLLPASAYDFGCRTGRHNSSP